MAEYRIVPSTHEHALVLAETMRYADVEEVWAASHFSPMAALEASMAMSPDTRTALADDTVLCMYGVGLQSLATDTGFPWMLTADAIVKHQRAFLRGSRGYISEIRSQYRLLLNSADARNIMALRWLKWLGFDIQPAVSFGAEGLPFHQFRMET